MPARSPGIDGFIYTGNLCTRTGFDFDRLKQLIKTSGVPGYEGRIRAFVREDLEAMTDSVRVDGMGNAVDTIEGESDYEVAIAAYMDRIGFMARHVNDEGFLQLDALDGWDPCVLKAQRMTVHAEDEDLTGVVDSVLPYTLTKEQKQKEPRVEDVYVDLGLPAKAVEEIVFAGDLVTMERITVRMGNHVTGRAIGDRICLLTMPGAAKCIGNPEATIHFATTIQKEVGLRGMQVLGVGLDPGLALDLDTTAADDVPGFDPADHVTKLGTGASIKLKDSSAAVNPKVHHRLRAVAEDDDIPYQIELLPAGGIDIGGLQNSYGAKPVGATPMPTRCLHTVTRSIHEDDMVVYIDLLAVFLESKAGELDYML